MNTSLRGKAVLVTGATLGMGRHLARALAVAGATVLLHGRDAARLDHAAGEVRAAAPGAAVRTYLADLADLDEVRDLAARVRRDEARLDVLVNNAAVGGHTAHREVSRQGHELRLAVNHLAAHLLTAELAPLLAASAPARVVNVASVGQSPMDFDDPMLERGYSWEEAYCRSKLAMIMSTFQLAEVLADRGVTVNALHPAHLMDTPMVRRSGLVPEVSVDEGVRPTLRLAADPALGGVTGRYFDRFDEADPHPQARDEKARARMAELTEALLWPAGASRDGEPAVPAAIPPGEMRA